LVLFGDDYGSRGGRHPLESIMAWHRAQARECAYVVLAPMGETRYY
jgi:hypothetical protein